MHRSLLQIVYLVYQRSMFFYHYRIHSQMKISYDIVCVGQAVCEECLGACSEGSVPSKNFKRLVADICKVKTDYTHRNNERVDIFKSTQYVSHPTTSDCPINDSSKIPSHWFELDHNDDSGGHDCGNKNKHWNRGYSCYEGSDNR